jgi:hypothetical protein
MARVDLRAVLERLIRESEESDIHINDQMKLLTVLCRNTIWDDEAEARLLLNDLFAMLYDEWCPSTRITECIAAVSEAAGALKCTKP